MFLKNTNTIMNDSKLHTRKVGLCVFLVCKGIAYPSFGQHYVMQVFIHLCVIANKLCALFLCFANKMLQ